MIETVNWTPAIAVVAGALVAGIALIRMALVSRAKAAYVGVADLEVRDLEGKRDALISQLRELEDTAAKKDADQVSRDRYAIELEAARTLRDLDVRTGGATAAALAATEAALEPGEEVADDDGVEVVERPVAGPFSGVKGFAWGVGSAIAVVGLLFYAFESASTRQEGGSLTGNTPGEMNAAAPAGTQPQDPAITSLEAKIRSNPDDFDARMELSYEYLIREQLIPVYEHTDYILQRNPQHPQALAYQALVRMAMGQPDVAVQMLKVSLKNDPQLLDGYVHLALVYTQTGKFDDAYAMIDEAMRRHPEEQQRLSSLRSEIKMRAASGAPPAMAAGSGEDPHKGIAAPVGASAPAAATPSNAPVAAAGSDATRLVATIDIDPAAKKRAGSATAVYVIARPAGVASGPPVAVKRMVASSFPLQLDLSAADSMMGQPLPAQIRLEVRLDSDGDAMSKNPSDPSATIDPVALGASGVRLTLR